MGTYAAVKFDTPTKKAIHRYCTMAGLPNAVRPDMLHSTLLYSRRTMDGYTPAGKYPTPIVAYPAGLSVFTHRGDDGQTTNCLVVLLKCPYLNERHHELMDKFDGTFDYDCYVPHVTLSYDIGDMEIESLPFFENYVPHIVIVEEEGEDLQEDWNATAKTINRPVDSSHENSDNRLHQ